MATANNDNDCNNNNNSDNDYESSSTCAMTNVPLGNPRNQIHLKTCGISVPVDTLFHTIEVSLYICLSAYSFVYPNEQTILYLFGHETIQARRQFK